MAEARAMIPPNGVASVLLLSHEYRLRFGNDDCPRPTALKRTSIRNRPTFAWRQIQPCSVTRKTRCSPKPRNEAGGIRCVYHGWKFDVLGNCLDMPNEPADSAMRNAVKARAYPARIAGEILWIYLGSANPAPELPAFEWLGVPAKQIYASRWEQDCNYAQAMKGEVDSAHVGFLHRLIGQKDADDRALTGRYFQDDTAPAWRILPTEAGFIACDGRRVEPDQRYWRLNQFLTARSLRARPA